ncbi:unnamed protein product [Rhizophagus irregularis]|nr:unnamed protein product [Rhizophagus irregularis]CAB5302884.1 unnamed protein product [Rhizophagus irregularis]
MTRHHNKKSFLSQTKYDIQMRARAIEHRRKIREATMYGHAQSKIIGEDTMYGHAQSKIIGEDTMYGEYEEMVRTAGFTIGLVSSQLHPRLQPKQSLANSLKFVGNAQGKIDMVSMKEMVRTIVGK